MDGEGESPLHSFFVFAPGVWEHLCCGGAMTCTPKGCSPLGASFIAPPRAPESAVQQRLLQSQQGSPLQCPAQWAPLHGQWTPG